MRKHPDIKVGTRVAYSREFCRNTGQFTGWTPHARGTVRALNRLSPSGPTIAAVEWDGAPSQGQVNVLNLWPEAKLHLEPV
jgi:hypothetical protein